MGCGCNEKKYNVSMGCCQPVLGPVENYYTKSQVDELIESAITSGSCCITEEEVDEKIASAKTDIEGEIPSLDGYATEEWVEDKHYITGVDLSDYALKSEIPTVPTSNTAFTNDASYQTSEEVNSAITEATSGKADNTDVYAYNGSSDGRITVNTAAGIRQKSIDLDVPIYKGEGLVSVSVNNPSGSMNGYNRITGNTSFGAGYMVSTNNVDEAAFGAFNISNGSSQTMQHSSGNTLFSVGNGHSQSTLGNIRRHNALEIRQNGDVYISDTNDTTQSEVWEKPMVKLQDTVSALGGLKLVSLTQSEYDALSPNYDSNTIYFIAD